jgi:hypothetical protein
MSIYRYETYDDEEDCAFNAKNNALIDEIIKHFDQDIDQAVEPYKSDQLSRRDMIIISQR